MTDDQAMYLRTSEGVVVLPGCTHAGVVNTLTHIHALTRKAPILAVIGGMHLLNASVERLRHTIECLQASDPTLLAPGHCTGLAATAQMWSAFPGRCTECCVGRRFVFD